MLSVTHGLRLGWLIDPQNKTVEIYREDPPVKLVPFSADLAGEPVLSGFSLDLAEIFA